MYTISITILFWFYTTHVHYTISVNYNFNSQSAQLSEASASHGSSPESSTQQIVSDAEVHSDTDNGNNEQTAEDG